jgi:hypothetical protein
MLHEDAAIPSPELQELKGEKALLETKVLGLQNRVQELNNPIYNSSSC